MAVTQPGVSGVNNLMQAGAGDFAARLASLNYSRDEIYERLKVRFPDADGRSLSAVLNRTSQGIAAAAAFASGQVNASLNCAQSAINPGLAAEEYLLVRLHFHDPNSDTDGNVDPDVYTTYGIHARGTDTLASIRDAVQYHVIQIWQSDTVGGDTAAEQLQFLGYEILYAECRSR